MFRLLLCLLCVCNVLDYVVGIGMLGKADAHFMSLTECEEVVRDMDFKVTRRKYNRTADVLDIIMKTPYDIGDDFILELKGAVKKEGGYKPGGMYMKEPACKTLKLLLGETFIEILKAAGVEDCPLPAGEHSVLEYYFDNENFNIPQVFGEYRTELTLSKGGVTRLCALMYYELVPSSY